MKDRPNIIKWITCARCRCWLFEPWRCKSCDVELEPRVKDKPTGEEG